MPYENFKSKNPLAAKIAANARKFDVQTLQNEDLVNFLLSEKKIEISSEQKEAARRVFTGLMNIEESVQLSG
ncbi:acetyltransferase [Campylobacter sp.]|uniref:acetyltransferase n=1 Tax=Campylobacter sp. TaxID=205 RepID=UPI0036102A28